MLKKLSLAAALAAAFIAPVNLATAATSMAPAVASSSTQEQLLLKLARDRAAYVQASNRLAAAIDKLSEAKDAQAVAAAAVAADRLQEGQLQEAVNTATGRLAQAQANLAQAQATFDSMVKDLGTAPVPTAEQMSQLKGRIAEGNTKLAADAKAVLSANEAVNAAMARLKSDMAEARYAWLPLLNADQAAVDTAAGVRRDALSALKAAQAQYQRDLDARLSTSVLAADRAIVAEAQSRFDQATAALQSAISKLQTDYAKAESAISALPRIVTDREAVAKATAARDAALAQQKADARALEADQAALRTAQGRYELAQRVKEAEAAVGPLAATVRERQAQLTKAQSDLSAQRTKSAKNAAALKTAQASAAAAQAAVQQADVERRAAAKLVEADLAALKALGYPSGATQP